VRFVRLLKHWYKEQTIQIKWSKHLSEPLLVTNVVRQGGVWSPYLFAVYLNDLSTELKNMKIGSYIGEILLNHLMFADDICVLCPKVRGLQSAVCLMCAWLMQNSMELFSTAAKLFV